MAAEARTGSAFCSGIGTNYLHGTLPGSVGYRYQPVLSGGFWGYMAGQEAIWHVLIDDRQRGPLTKAEVLEHLNDGLLSASNFVWRPGFSDWKLVSEIGEFWQSPPPIPQSRTSVRSAPERAHEPIDTPSTRKQWNLWKTANIGLLMGALTLLLQIGNGRGFELANYAHTANAETVSRLVGQVLGAPLIFVLIAVVRNRLNQQQPKSSVHALWGALTFTALFAGIMGGLVVYGEIFFSSTEAISGEARQFVITTMHRSCVQKQRSLGQNITEAQIDTYCTCASEKLAENTTYQQLGRPLDVSATADLKQKAEAIGYACRQ